MRAFFPDVNFWFALAVEEHAHHRSALDWWEQDSDRILFSRYTQMGLLRLLTTPAMMLGKPLTMSGAWSVFDSLSIDPRVRFVGEPESLGGVFRSLTSSEIVAPKLWMDAYLQSFSHVEGAALVTFDRALAMRCPQSLLLA